MKKIIPLIIIAVLLIPTLFFIFNNKANINKTLIEKNESFNVYKLIFKSNDNYDIYALLFAPIKENFDLVIVLPGAGGTKESRRTYAEMLLQLRYGSLLLDQRGIGETKAPVYSFEEDFNNFLQGKDVSQYLMATDAISAIEALKKIKSVNNIAILGESMGGRNAIIASALDKRIKGAIIISSAGYSQTSYNPDFNRFISSINPNSYISQISPARILMLHSLNDNVIPIKDAKETFSQAKKPKKFVEFNESECIHGYCKPMHPYIKNELKLIFHEN